MLTPGDGVDGVIFTQFPLSGTIAAADPANQAVYNKERAGGPDGLERHRRRRWRRSSPGG